MNAAGVHAELFTLQAAAYTTPPSPKAMKNLASDRCYRLDRPRRPGSRMGGGRRLAG